MCGNDQKHLYLPQSIPNPNRTLKNFFLPLTVYSRLLFLVTHICPFEGQSNVFETERKSFALPFCRKSGSL